MVRRVWRRFSKQCLPISLPPSPPFVFDLCSPLHFSLVFVFLFFYLPPPPPESTHLSKPGRRKRPPGELLILSISSTKPVNARSKLLGRTRASVGEWLLHNITATVLYKFAAVSTLKRFRITNYNGCFTSSSSEPPPGSRSTLKKSVGTSRNP
jgi:hypothetical protein